MFHIKSKSNVSLTRCITLKRVTSWRDPSSRHCARQAQLLSKKYRSGGEPSAILSDLTGPRFEPPAPETNALPLDQMVDDPDLRRLNFELLCCTVTLTEKRAIKRE